MSLAAVDLQGGQAKIIDVAAKYGYTSPTAFNRAFRSVHGINPSAVKKEGVAIKSFPLSKEITQNFLEVPQMWQGAVLDGTIAKIISLMNEQPQGVLGVSACSDNEEWRYYIAVSSSADIDNSLEEYMIPGCTWAIFPGAGTGKSIQELEKRIVTEWLPTSGFEFTDGPDIEVYFDPNPQNTTYEVWIPVKKKQP